MAPLLATSRGASVLPCRLKISFQSLGFRVESTLKGCLCAALHAQVIS